MYHLSLVDDTRIKHELPLEDVHFKLKKTKEREGEKKREPEKQRERIWERKRVDKNMKGFLSFTCFSVHY